MPRTDEERLRLFCERVAFALERRAVAERTLGASWSLKVDVDEGTRVETDFGDVEDNRSLLLELRKFFAAREDVFFTAVANTVERRTTDAEVLAANRVNRASWLGMQQGGGMDVIVNDKKITPGLAFDLYVNGEVFHLDDSKAKEFETIPDFMKGMVMANVHGMMISALRVLDAERNLIADGLERGLFTFD